MPLNTGDRIFPYGGSPGGGGSTPGNPDGGAFTATETNVLNLSSIGTIEVQWFKFFKVVTCITKLRAEINAAGAFGLDIDLPITPDSTDILAGTGNDTIDNALKVYGAVGNTARIRGIASGASPAITLTFTFTYKSAS